MTTKAAAKTKKRAQQKQQSNGRVGKAGGAGFRILNGLINFSGSTIAPAAVDFDTNEIPPFVSVLAILMGLVVLGFIIYVAAIWLGA